MGLVYKSVLIKERVNISVSSYVYGGNTMSSVV